MRSVLFTGLPGSGKSTAISILASFLESRDGSGSVLVLKAEEGEQDAACQVPPGGGCRTVDLSRGCVGCTSLTAGLYDALEDLHSGPSPSWLIIEASLLGFQTIKQTVTQSLPEEAQPFTVLLIESGGWAELCEEAPLLADGIAAQADLALINQIASRPPDAIFAVADRVSRAKPALPVKTLRLQGLPPGDLFSILAEAGLESPAAPAAAAAHGTADERASVPPAPA
jgi:G3E family GTPase